MSEEQKKPGVAFWATIVVVTALVVYPLSTGPMYWLASRTSARDIDTVREMLRHSGAPAARDRDATVDHM